MTANSFSTENTSLVLNGHGFKDYLDGDIIEMTPVNPLTSQVRGRTAVNIIKRSDYGVYDMTVRVVRFSDDDVYLNTQLNQISPVIFKGSLRENFISDSGIQSVSNWSLGAGSITDQPTEIINNTDGNFLTEYKFRFNDCIRSI
jgi:hypothetical protein